VKKKPTSKLVIVEGQCAGPSVCPLTRVRAGSVVCIKELLAAPEIRDRLRELGLGEEQQIKLLSKEANVICQVCNARLGISEKLAEAILVEPVAAAAMAG
jgi:Fe2+ transport system protein FeoA